jgi:iron uptake system component EfeO
VAAVAAVALLCAACGSDEPGAPGGDGTVIDVTITPAGCLPDPIEASAGTIGFAVTNDGATAVSEFEILDADDRILGEVENIAAGLSGGFSVSLPAGDYVTYCPGATRERGSLHVTAGG